MSGLLVLLPMRMRIQTHVSAQLFFIGEIRGRREHGGCRLHTDISIECPDLFHRGLPHRCGLIQTSPPDDHGYMSLGVSVDIVKAATE